MATSLDDLLRAVDQASRGDVDPSDAAHALLWSSRLLDRLRDDGALYFSGHDRDGAVRRLGEACRYAATSFAGQPGRASDLIGATHDAVGLLRRHLSEEDRWATAVRFAPATRRWSTVITRSGPYDAVPELAAVADRSRELLHLAAVRPLDVNALRGLDLPIPSTVPTEVATVNEAAAELVGGLCRAGRQPLTMREVTAACHAAYQLAAWAAIAARPHGADIAAAAYATAQRWKEVREVVTLYADAPRLCPAPTNVMTSVISLDTAVRHELIGGIARPAAASAELRMASNYLGRLAEACHAEIVRLGPRLVVPHGPRPLGEHRVEQWLRHKVFLAKPTDLMPALRALEHAHEQAAAVARFLEGHLQLDCQANIQRAALRERSVEIGL